MKFLAYLLLCLVADALVVLGDVCAKRWVLGEGVDHFVGALAMYTASVFVWLYFLQLNGSLAKASVLWSVTGLLAASAVGVWGFGEVLSVYTKIGLGLAVLSTVFIGLGK